MVHARSRIIAGLIAGVLLALWGPVSFAQTADTPETVRFGWFGGPRPWVIGMAKGTFEEALGTRIEWVQFPSGAAALNSLAAGEVDISRLGSTPTVAAIARGLPIEMIAISGVIATSERLIATDDIGAVAELTGKRIAYPPGSTAHYALMAALKVNEVPASDVTLLALTPTEMVAAFLRGDIDAGYVWGPFSHQMEEAGGHEILATEDLQEHGYYVWNDYVVRKEFAEQHPELVVAFLVAFQETMDMYHDDTEAVVKLVADHLSQDVDAVRDTMAGLDFPALERQLSDELLGEGGAIPAAMTDTANFLVELGDLREREVPADFRPFINTTYLEQAVERN